MENFYELKSGAVLRFFLKVLGVLLVLNLAVLSIEYYFENYTTSKITSRYTFQTYVTGMFYFDGERNVPSYFSTLNLLISAFLLFTISKYVKRSTHPQNFRKWYLMGCVFVWLALDELFALHEISAKPMRTLLQNYLQQENLGFLHFAWFVPYLLVLLGVGAYFFRFVLSLPGKTLSGFFLAGVIFMAGAVGMEMVSGLIVSHDLLAIYKIITTVEETLEMLGVILFIHALIKHLEHQKGLNTITINIAVGPQSQGAADTERANPAPEVQKRKNILVA
ncbi:hypothetical protein [Rufibacter psychrotolerans]|uniref:hypothetical protein n=1 Tax=Rufibacter psychrotolerans TaxID=2812556 RepID=UPI001966E8C6|nr:hypothetical protein [Rufibacter sp. SYSU D00308]